LIGAPVIYHKIPLRIDVPFENKELAFWHQDDFYVQGNNSEVTVWIPLQDTFAHTGALSVMKGSHLNGAIPHSYRVGKKSVPVGVFDAPVNIIEMNKGDVLFFSSYLIHSSNLNISDQIRYSIQLRYSAASAGEQSSLMKGFTHV
jgi:ectoine hydroxylase-related dioxygenase (phytanoyl-CoA dioxygenase family)